MQILAPSAAPGFNPAQYSQSPAPRPRGAAPSSPENGPGRGGEWIPRGASGGLAIGHAATPAAGGTYTSRQALGQYLAVAAALESGGSRTAAAIDDWA